jgi:hypothetical protein
MPSQTIELQDGTLVEIPAGTGKTNLNSKLEVRPRLAVQRFGRSAVRRARDISLVRFRGSASIPATDRKGAKL